MSDRRVRVATAQYPLEFLANWQAFAGKIDSWVGRAAGQGAQILLFPEYFSIEITAIFGAEVTASLAKQLQRLQDTLPDFLDLFRTLATHYGVHICAGSYPVSLHRRYHNRAYFFWPDGGFDFQEKLQMTRFESEQWGIDGGNGLKVFNTDIGRFAVNVCYDSEFPLLARQQVEQGADVILVPSCTDSEAGFHRVRIGCQARALENQCYVVQSPTVGDCPWSEAIDRNVGYAAIYVPADRGFPSDGVLAAGTMNVGQWLYADLDLCAIAEVRAQGQVFNHRDWNGQKRHIEA